VIVSIESLEFHIAIPFGGSENYLHQTLESVMGQTYGRWKLFVIGDGISPDRFDLISLNYNDSRIEFYTFPNKQGIGKMFNHCLEKLDSDWNLILGADDLLSPQFLENLIEAVRIYPDVGFIQPRTQVIDSAGQIQVPLDDFIKSLIRHRWNAHEYSSRSAIYSLALGNWLYFPSIVWSRESLQNKTFNVNFEIALDLELILRILNDGGTVLYWPKSLFFYRRHSASISMDPSKYFRRVSEEIELYNALSSELFKKRQFLGGLISKLRLTSRLNLVLKITTFKQVNRKSLFKLLMKL